MLVSAKEMLNKAKAGHYAVGQFNINNLEWTKSILLAAEETRSPVILGVSEGAGKYMTGYKTVVGMVNGMLEELNISVPVALHLDHGSYEGCYKCIEAGFSSIMFDGSHYPIEENIEKTKELVQYKSECIRTIQTASGVDVFRVSNLLNIIKEIDTFLDINFNAICTDNPQLQAIQHQHKQLKKKIEFIENNL